MDTGIPEVLGKCRLKEKLGEGAMAVVYLAEHMTLRIPMAVKILHERWVKEGGAAAKRFVQEARIAARINHPNIVRVYDCGKQGSYFYLVMDYIEGQTCKQLLDKDGPLPWAQAVRVVMAVAEGLRSAAEEGVIHRDIKPDNIMIDAKGIARVTDLGIAKLSGEVMQTAADGMLGTPYYMSPEQVRDAGSVDFRTDIYSLGATLYHLICGVPPFEGRTSYEVINQHLGASVPSPRNIIPDLPRPLCDVIAKTMAKDPESRYQTYEVLIEDLQSVLAGDYVVAEGAEQQVQQEGPFKAESLAQLRGGRELAPAQIPVPASATAASLCGLISLLGFALAALILFHTLRSSQYAFAGWVFAAVAVVAYAGYTRLSTRPVGQRIAPETQDDFQSRALSVLAMLSNGLCMREPALYLSTAARPWFSSRGLLRRLSITLSREIGEKLQPTDRELGAGLARQLGRFYYGHAALWSLVAGPTRIFSAIVRPVNALCDRAHDAQGTRLRPVPLAGAALYVLALAVGLALLLVFWFPGGLAVTVFVLASVAAVCLRRYGDYAADLFAAALLANREPVRMLIAKQALASPGDNRVMLAQAGLPEARPPGVAETAAPPARDRAERVISYFCDNEWRRGRISRLCALFSQQALPALRLNVLMGLHKPAFPAVVKSVLTKCGSLLGAGRAERERFLPESKRLSVFALQGLIAGVAMSAGIAWLKVGGGAEGEAVRYAAFVAIVCTVAVSLGWLSGKRFVRNRGTCAELSLSLLATVVFLMLPYMLILAPALGGRYLMLLGQTPIVSAFAALGVCGGAMLAVRTAKARAQKAEAAEQPAG